MTLTPMGFEARHPEIEKPQAAIASPGRTRRRSRSRGPSSALGAAIRPRTAAARSQSVASTRTVAGAARPRDAALALALAVAVIGTGALAGCSVGAPRYHPQRAGSQPEVLVRPLRLDVSTPDYTGSTDFGRLLAENLAGALQERGVRAVLVDGGAADPPASSYVVEGEITQLDPGSQNLRVWIGLGAGQAYLAARVQVVSTGDGRTVFDQTLDVHSATWQGQDDILRRCSASLADQVATRLVRDLHLAATAEAADLQRPGAAELAILRP